MQEATTTTSIRSNSVQDKGKRKIVKKTKVEQRYRMREYFITKK